MVENIIIENKYGLQLETKILKKIIRFRNNIGEWYSQQNKRLDTDINELRMPNSNKNFFEGKLYEIYLRYQSARIMMHSIDNNDNEYWYYNTDKEINNHIIRLNYNGFFLENAILNYNIVVDLTWIITFLSIDICYYKDNNKFVFDEINQKEESKTVINKIEKFVQSPDVDEIKEFLNYFSSLHFKYEEVVNHITSFWQSFSTNEIRYLYNYLKHRGKPEYTEIYKLTGKKFFSYYDGDKEYATDMSDIRKEISMYNQIEKLIDFDDNILFPYCNKLFQLLINIIYN